MAFIKIDSTYNGWKPANIDQLDPDNFGGGGIARYKFEDLVSSLDGLGVTRYDAWPNSKPTVATLSNRRNDLTYRPRLIDPGSLGYFSATSNPHGYTMATSGKPFNPGATGYTYAICAYYPSWGVGGGWCTLLRDDGQDYGPYYNWNSGKFVGIWMGNGPYFYWITRGSINYTNSRSPGLHYRQNDYNVVMVTVEFGVATKVYVNGLLSDTSDLQEVADNSPFDLYIGNDGGWGLFQVPDTSLWNRPLTSIQAADYYTAYKTVHSTYGLP